MSSLLRSPLASLTDTPSATVALCAGSLTLSDLSLQRRSGLRGSDAPEWLVQHGLPQVATPNRIEAAGEQQWVMALSKREFWMLDGNQMALEERPASVAEAPNAWPLYCQHSHVWWHLSGDDRAALMAKLCGVDLSETAFPLGNVAQTQMARISVVVAHHDWQGVPGFSLFLDQTLAAYAWSALWDAMQEFNCAPC
jgi:sarcosine oxidase subunit gamma